MSSPYDDGPLSLSMSLSLSCQSAWNHLNFGRDRFYDDEGPCFSESPSLTQTLGAIPSDVEVAKVRPVSFDNNQY